MSKETKLTVMVPISDEDCENQYSPYASLGELERAILPSDMNVNTIYKVSGGLYYRSQKSQNDAGYSYLRVTNREFPYLGRPLEIFDFTYDATRMGKASTITAQNVMWYADKDTDGKDRLLDKLWSEDCFVSFNGENFYLKQTPTSTKENSDARYKYDIDFVSQDVVLETAYIYDTLIPYTDDKSISDDTKFSFFGDIVALKERINSSLIKNGISQYVLQARGYFSYKDWGDIALGVYNGPLPTTRDEEFGRIGVNVVTYYNGSYARYLQTEVINYDPEARDFLMTGYKVVIGKDARGDLQKSEQKLIKFEDNTIYEALQTIKNDFGLQYYIKRSGNNTLIVIGDCEYDFGDRDALGELVRDENSELPQCSSPFSYGADNELLSIEKANNTEKIVTSITGRGGDVNIPWFYPNPTPDGWIKPMYNSAVSALPSQCPSVSYPKVEGETDFEKFIKNRIGANFVYGATYTHTVEETGITRGVGTSESTYRVTFKFDKYNFSWIKPFIINIRLHTAITPTNILFKIGYKSSGSVVNVYTESLNSYTYNINQLDPPSGCDLSNIPDNAEMVYSLEFDVPKAIFDMAPSNLLYYYPSWAFSVPAGIFNNLPFVKHTVYLPAIFSRVKLHAVISFTNDTEASFYALEGSDEPYTEFENILLLDQKYVYVHGVGTEAHKLEREKSCSQNLKDCPRWVWRLYESKTGLHPYAFADIHWEQYKYVELNVIEPPDVLLPAVKFDLSFTDLEWFKEGATYNPIQLSDYGITLTYPQGVESHIGDTISFKRVKYLTPQKNLMPELYIKTDGSRRFYPAFNYERNGILVKTNQANMDVAMGEEWQEEAVTPTSHKPAGVRNPIYKDNGEDAHYLFEREIRNKKPLQHIEPFEDIRPSICGQKVNNLRIDVVEMFAYDQLDDDTIWVDTSTNNDNTYKHPHFFAKLRPLGFNLFDHALQDDMVISMTTGHCGACNFKIKVDDKTKKNPVQVWEHDVYEKETVGGVTTYTKVYNQGDLVRYVDTIDLYYEIDNSYVEVNQWWRYSNIVSQTGQIVYIDALMSVYTEEEVSNGYVGTLQQDGKYHFVGDVVTSGKFMPQQQDTTSNYVWVALEKDIETFGTIMPSAPTEFIESGLRPASIADVHTGSSTVEEDEEKADKFVIVNIRLPLQYLRNAERELSKALVKYMFKNNYQKFNFSIKFSRIFFAQNLEISELLNENSVLYVEHDAEVFRQYVQHYSYHAIKDEALPEITVDMREDLSAVTNHADIYNNDDGYIPESAGGVFGFSLGTKGNVGNGGNGSGVSSQEAQSIAISRQMTRRLDVTTRQLEADTSTFKNDTEAFEQETRAYADAMSTSVKIIKNTLNPDIDGVPQNTCYWQDDLTQIRDRCVAGEVHRLIVPDFGAVNSGEEEGDEE